MDSRLINASNKKKEELELELKNSHILDVVREVLMKRMETKDKTSEKDYEIPSWALLQADRAGYMRALTDVLNLIKK